jgi:hypothetical protein
MPSPQGSGKPSRKPRCWMLAPFLPILQEGISPPCSILGQPDCLVGRTHDDISGKPDFQCWELGGARTFVIRQRLLMMQISTAHAQLTDCSWSSAMCWAG